MLQEKCTYEEFYRERRPRVRKRADLQQKDILNSIEKLYEQNDFWSLEMIRELTTIFIGNDEVKAYKLYYSIVKMMRTDDDSLKAIETFITAVTR